MATVSLPSMHRQRAIAFVLSLVVAFVLPFVIPGLGASMLSTFTVSIILLAWISLKWGTLVSLPSHSRLWEVGLGGAIIAADVAENLVFHSALGLTDALIVFVGLWVGFFGLRHIRLFVLPSLYILVLIAGYLVEYHIPSVAGLEYFIANLMTSMLKGLGVTATVSQNMVTLYTPSPVFLQVDGPCTGLQGILAFGMLASMTVLDIKAEKGKLALVLVVGFLGAFLINFVRLAMIFLSFEYLGTGVGASVHAYAGYLIFLGWVLIFWNFAFKYLAKGKPMGRTLVGPTTL